MAENLEQDKVLAGVAQWQCACFPSKTHGFDSRYPLKRDASMNLKIHLCMKKSKRKTITVAVSGGFDPT